MLDSNAAAVFQLRLGSSAMVPHFRAPSTATFTGDIHEEAPPVDRSFLQNGSIDRFRWIEPSSSTMVENARVEPPLDPSRVFVPGHRTGSSALPRQCYGGTGEDERVSAGW